MLQIESHEVGFFHDSCDISVHWLNSCVSCSWWSRGDRVESQLRQFLHCPPHRTFHRVSLCFCPSPSMLAVRTWRAQKAPQWGWLMSTPSFIHRTPNNSLSLSNRLQFCKDRLPLIALHDGPQNPFGTPCFYPEVTFISNTTYPQTQF